MDYAALIAPLAFLASVQLSTKLNTSAVFNASLVVGLPFLIDRIFAWLVIAGRDAPFFSNVFSIQSLSAATVQFIVAWYVFKMLQLSDGCATWLTWVIGGGVTVVYVVPALVGFVI